jgi:predicted acyl esterase
MRGRGIAIAVVVSLLVGGLAAAAPSAHAEEVGQRTVDIYANDGVPLRAVVLEPKSAGPHPAVVLISAWGGGSTQNIVPATRLAERGYVVVAYGARGFGEAGGEVDVAGPLDVADVSTVIDWTINNTATDVSKIGVGAVSYGAGIALIASAFDNRIRSIASMSGWFDLVHSLSRDETRRGAVTQVLYLSGLANGDLSDESDWMLRTFFEENPDPEHTETLKAWARVRSPITYLDRINQNRPALLIEHTFSETVFPPDQMVDLYNRFQGTKRLDLVPGEHASSESGGLLGLPSETWDTVNRWFDATLAGTDSSILDEPPVSLRPRGGEHLPRESYPDWQSSVGEPRRYFLSPGDGQDGVLGDAPAGEVAREITADRDTMANGGIPLLTYSLEALTGEPPTTFLPFVDRNAGALWFSPKLPSVTKVRGGIRAQLTVTPSAKTGTLIAYLFDVDGGNTGRLVNFLPYSWTEATPGQPIPVDLKYSETAYDVPAGHRLALVVDTTDPLYIDWNTGPGPMTFGSPAAHPSYVDIPVAR